jgi:hypothetical protein
MFFAISRDRFRPFRAAWSAVAKRLEAGHFALNERAEEAATLTAAFLARCTDCAIDRR